MNPRILQVLALAFIILVVLQSILGGVLFWHSIGMTPHAVFSHYEHKSLHGLLEVVLPHALFIATALMATLHFLSFIQTITENTKRVLTHLLFSLFILDQGSVFFIASGFELFAIIKLASFILFELVLGWVWIIIFLTTLKELK